MTDDAPERRWTIRDYQPGDEQAIVALFEAVFGKTMGPTESLEHWVWEYASNPLGTSIIKLAWDGSTLAGHYAVSPRRIFHGHGGPGGGEILAALSLDTMTNPEYGRQGIFTRTAEACYETMAAKSMEFVYGFPNVNSAPSIESRLRWTMMGTPPIHVKPLDIGPWLAARRPELAAGPLISRLARAACRGPALLAKATSHLDGSREIQVHRCAEFDTWADELWDACKEQHDTWVVRDRAFLSWRYTQRPESDYLMLRAEHEGQIAGYIVLGFAEQSEGPGCFIMDLLCRLDVRGTTMALLAGAEAAARQRGSAFMSALVSPKARYRPTLYRSGFVPLPETWMPKEMHFGSRTMTCASTTTPPTAEAWQQTWGDSDVL